MKKTFFILALSLVSLGMFAQQEQGEMAIGLRGNFGIDGFLRNMPGVGVQFNYGLTEQIRLAPSFDYFFEDHGFSAWMLNADVHYLFNVAPRVNVFPLAGLTLLGTRMSWDDGWGDYDNGNGSSTYTDTHFGVNLGGGVDYLLNDRFTIGLQLKYSLISNFNQFLPSVNVMWRF
jgi:outer membrane protein X